MNISLDSITVSESCDLYLMHFSACPFFRELLGCSIPCLREQQVGIVFELCLLVTVSYC